MTDSFRLENDLLFFLIDRIAGIHTMGRFDGQRVYNIYIILFVMEEGSA